MVFFMTLQQDLRNTSIKIGHSRKKTSKGCDGGGGLWIMNKPKSTSKGVDRNIRSSWKKRMRFHCGKTQAEADVNSVQSAKVAAGFLAIWKENEREGPRSSNKPLRSSKATLLTSCSLHWFLLTAETVIVWLIISTTSPLTHYHCSFHR